MAQSAPARPKVNTKPTQAWDASGPGVSRRPARGSTRVRGEARESARGRAVIELDAGITVYPRQAPEGYPSQRFESAHRLSGQQRCAS